jgi:hypothetical protein
MSPDHPQESVPCRFAIASGLNERTIMSPLHRAACIAAVLALYALAAHLDALSRPQVHQRGQQPLWLDPLDAGGCDA